ncbi:MAG: DUF4278 domain-containing protein [Cyanobacteria bacterium P01_H01_bin.119]
MNLFYRGVKYEAPQNQVEMGETEIIGRYRGAAISRRSVKHAPVQNRVSGLKYRGAEVR